MLYECKQPLLFYNAGNIEILRFAQDDIVSDSKSSSFSAETKDSERQVIF